MARRPSRARPEPPPTTVVALLRGVNVGGNRPVPMAELRVVAERVGLRDVRTYIQSGNLVGTASVEAAEAERALERALEVHFGFEVPVVARPAERWRALAVSCPFTDAARPQVLLLGLSQRPPRPGVEAELAPYCTAGERVAALPDGLWVDYGAGSARSRLTTAVLDRVVGSTVTTRNWRTVQVLAEMTRAGG